MERECGKWSPHTLHVFPQCGDEEKKSSVNFCEITLTKSKSQPKKILNSQKKMFFGEVEVPKEIVVKIFGHLTLGEVLAFESVNSEWRRFVEGNAVVWKDLFKIHGFIVWSSTDVTKEVFKQKFFEKHPHAVDTPPSMFFPRKLTVSFVASFERRVVERSPSKMRIENEMEECRRHGGAFQKISA